MVVMIGMGMLGTGVVRQVAAHGRRNSTAVR
jgi:hypothetical protein